jgi:hypothetical protein
VTETLARHKQGLKLPELAKEILASGYKTSSTNFQNTLYQVLYHNSGQLVHDLKARTYCLKPRSKKAHPVRQPAAARKSRPSVMAGERKINAAAKQLLPMPSKVEVKSVEEDDRMP